MLSVWDLPVRLVHASRGKAARAELRAYTAEQSVRLAEDIIRREMRPEDDARLVKEYVEELGGVGR